MATYTHDLASDREETLTLQVGTDPAQTLVSSAAYLRGGPLTSAGLGNGLTETRTYTDRYHPTAIDVPGITTLAYTTDVMGNITRIDRSLLGNTYLLLYKYQDTQYFLTQGHGPWGQRTWTYDKIGNRLTENRGASDANNPLPESTYTYGLNPAGGNTPKLLEVTGPLGDEELVSSHSFAYDGAGNQYQIAPDAGSTTLLSYDDASRLTTLGDGSDETSVTYDGRGFLTLSQRTTVGSADYLSTEAVYDSQGLLHCVERSGSQAGLTFDESTYVLYFAGRPIAQVTVDNQGVSPDEILYLTTDHLGTPIAATDASGVATWQGGLSPFGVPYSYADTGGGGGDPGDGGALMYSAAQSVLLGSPEEAGIFLRFPGQWEDGTFEGYVPGGIYQNVYRYYLAGTGRYSRPDPLGLGASLHTYGYSRLNPLRVIDPLGLADSCFKDPQLIPCGGPGGGCCVARCLDDVRFALCEFRKAHDAVSLAGFAYGAGLGAIGGGLLARSPAGACLGGAIGGLIGSGVADVIHPKVIFRKQQNDQLRRCLRVCNPVPRCSPGPTGEECWIDNQIDLALGGVN